MKITVAGLVAVGVAAPLLIDASPSHLVVHTSMAAAATRDSYVLTTPTALPLLPNAVIESGSLSIAPIESGDASTGAAVLALLTGGKARLVLENAMLSVAPRQSAEPIDGKNSYKLAPILSTLVDLSFSQLEVRNSSVRLGRDANPHALLTNVSAQVTMPKAGEATVTGTFVYRNIPFSFDIVMGTSAQLVEGQTKDDATIGRHVDLKLRSPEFSLETAGTLSAGTQPKFKASKSIMTVKDVRLLAAFLGVTWSEVRGPQSFEADGALEVSQGAVSFADAKFKIDGNEATGALSVKWSQAKPALEGTLAFATLDITPFLAAPATDDANKNGNLDLADYLRTRPSAGTYPLLAKLDADLRMSSGKIVWGALSFGKGAASLSLKDGILLTDLAELEVGKGGRCSGQLSVQDEDGRPHYALRGKTEGIDLAVFSQALWAYNVLSGVGDVTVDLTAMGDGKQEIVSSLTGKVTIAQAATGQVGVDLKTLAATARSQTQKGWGGATRGQTAIEGMQANLSLVNGTASVESLSARAGDANLSAEGQMRFPERLGDIKIWITHPDTATPDVNGAETAQAADQRGSGGGLHLRGSIEMPEVRFMPLNERRSINIEGLQMKTPVAPVSRRG